MKERAIKYLNKNPLIHMGMIEPIRRNTAEILYAEADGVLMKETKSNAYMISVDSPERGKAILDMVTEGKLFVAHQTFMVDYIVNRFLLEQRLECVQAVYLDKHRLSISKELEIRQLGQSHKKVILEHYKKLSEDEILELLNDGAIFGGYKDGVLIGFIGKHLEGSLGLLEIFPEYRRLGYGTILESFLVNLMLDQGYVPYGQIEINNKNSITLQQKLGFSVSEDCLYWLF